MTDAAIAEELRTLIQNKRKLGKTIADAKALAKATKEKVKEIESEIDDLILDPGSRLPYGEADTVTGEVLQPIGKAMGKR